MREGRLPPSGDPTHTPNPGALKVWDGDATNPIGDATNPLHPVGAMLLGSPNPIKGVCSLGSATLGVSPPHFGEPQLIAALPRLPKRWAGVPMQSAPPAPTSEFL